MSIPFDRGYIAIRGVSADKTPQWALPVIDEDGQSFYDGPVHPERRTYLPENVRFLKAESATGDHWWTHAIDVEEFIATLNAVPAQRILCLHPSKWPISDTFLTGPYQPALASCQLIDYAATFSTKQIQLAEQEIAALGLECDSPL